MAGLNQTKNSHLTTIYELTFSHKTCRKGKISLELEKEPNLPSFFFFLEYSRRNSKCGLIARNTDSGFIVINSENGAERERERIGLSLHYF